MRGEATLRRHAVGSLAPAVGCIVIESDGSREVARVERDPLATDPDS